MQRSGPIIYYLWSSVSSCISRNPFKALSIHVNHNECIFEDIFFFSCVLLPNSVVCTRRLLQGDAQSLLRVVCPYTLSNLCQRLKTKNLVTFRLLKGNLI